MSDREAIVNIVWKRVSEKSIVVGHIQVYFVNSIQLNDLNKNGGKLLGEVLINQMKAARKRGGWKKRADLRKVGVDEFLYTSNKKKLSHFFRDAIFVLMGFKPALDAYRVGSGAEH
ncbi:hypothetical protein TrLO_g4234 [Triparma laevis f. longispina]|uniref:Uncharacterized protein n=1 Tax=Triparma laevis f. longispina TaxID=1714387 RepID=A0A9W7AVB1_9STRA|nr:hypothetical protein TrLO_g4234 [Triparma laevis f. longispina]